MALYTDIAAEIYPPSRGTCPRGVRTHTASAAGVSLTRVDITRDGLRRPRGCYITLDMPDFARIDDRNEAYVLAVASQLRSLVPREGPVLVAGIGNDDVTADAIGPQTAKRVFTTRALPDADGELDLRCVAAVAPGVRAATGISVAEMLRGAVKAMRPGAVVCVDSLCTADVRRLGCSVQLSTAGLNPLSADALTEQTLGVPVVAVGVPTVMEAHVKSKSGPLVVTPRDIDSIVRRASSLLALALNKALQPSLSVGELSFLTS